MESMFWPSLVAAIAGLVIAIIGAMKVNKPVTVIGLIIFVAGMTLTSVFFSSVDKDKFAELKNRFHWVTKAVVETHQTQTENGECVQSFKLDTVPYTLEAECSKFCVGDKVSPPRVGDFMKVLYIAPKEPDGKPELVLAQNLTQELELAGGMTKCKPEAPAEAPSVSPEAPTDWQTRPLPDIY